MLQCIVELAASGCVAAPGIRLSSNLLERVKRHTEAWRRLSFTSETHIFTEFVQIHSSVCCQVSYTDASLSRTRMVFYQAPAAHRGVLEQKWEVDYTCSPGRDQDVSAFDQAQDILVIIEVDKYVPLPPYYCSSSLS